MSLVQCKTIFYIVCGNIKRFSKKIDKLQKEYKFLNQKFNLDNTSVRVPSFFKLHPYNLPTIRISQLANVYYSNQNLFSKAIDGSSIEDMYLQSSVENSEFWKNILYFF
ncbi:DUF2851 family protein [Hyunsoonleella jejuensis]|uniref:DUF2851 family protein n=1 Tax=Hyunsoonleella jejuensis TaxID=419940 RepID=UPI000B821463|nr:DUF2851 family protein [Hyunsoonleella jejuensis]